MRHTLFTLILAGVLAACGNGKTHEEEQQAGAPEQEATGPATHRMPEYDHSDTVTAGGSLYRYAIHREPADSLPQVSDEFGDTYVDNAYTLRVEREGKPFFRHTYTKQALRGLLPKSFAKQGIMDGFRFNRVEGRSLVFSLCVSYPDSDLSAPFSLTISPSGQAAIAPDDTPALELEDSDGV